MAGVLGIVAIALGIGLLCIWWPAVWGFLQGLLVLSLLFWGLVALLVHHARNKARRDYARARRDDSLKEAQPAPISAATDEDE